VMVGVLEEPGVPRSAPVTSATAPSIRIDRRL
jgi:hypothetical protein